VHEELRALNGRMPSFQDVNSGRLAYTQMAVKETLRMYPPIPLFPREVAHTDVLPGGYELPGGDVVFMSTYAMGRNPLYWPEPLSFRPERFTPEAEAARPRFAWVPFGAGPRMCLGANFAVLAVTQVVATLLQHFEFEGISPSGKELPFAYDITMNFPGGVNMRIRPRPDTDNVTSSSGVSSSGNHTNMRCSESASTEIPAAIAVGGGPWGAVGDTGGMGSGGSAGGRGTSPAVAAGLGGAQAMPPHLDLRGAAIQTFPRDAAGAQTTIVLPNQRSDVLHFALDIGGSLIKLVYFSRIPPHLEHGASFSSLVSPSATAAAAPAVTSTAAGNESTDCTTQTNCGATAAAAAAPPPAFATATAASAAAAAPGNLAASASAAAAARAVDRRASFSGGGGSFRSGGGGGRLHFVKFETSRIVECIEFIKSKRLHSFDILGMGGDEESLWGYGASSPRIKEKLGVVLDKEDEMLFELTRNSPPCTTPAMHHCPRVVCVWGQATGGGAFKYADLFKEKLGVVLDKEDEMLFELTRNSPPCTTPAMHHCPRVVCVWGQATGGGAFKYADLFKEKLGVVLDKEDEMRCLVLGLNFLLRSIRDEAFTHLEGEKQFVEMHSGNIFPYLLVNIGSGVSILKVDGPQQYERVSGTNLGGGTFWGLGSLLTGCKSFDKILELSQEGDNSAVDMLVGDIYGGLNYEKIGLSASTIASSFGRVVGEQRQLSDYRPEDIALSLLRMVSYNIGQIAYLNALRYNLKRIFFGGFFIRGHAYTMDTISFAIKFWSKGEKQAMFLRHEGYLGALGAFLAHEEDAHAEGRGLSLTPGIASLSSLTPSQLVERFPMGAPFSKGEIRGPVIRGLKEKVSWVEKFVQVGSDITAPTPTGKPPTTTGLGGFARPREQGKELRSDESALSTMGSLAVGSLAVGSLAVGSLAVGSLAVGSLAVGSLAVGSLAVGSFAVGSLVHSLPLFPVSLCPSFPFLLPFFTVSLSSAFLFPPSVIPSPFHFFLTPSCFSLFPSSLSPLPPPPATSPTQWTSQTPMISSPPHLLSLRPSLLPSLSIQAVGSEGATEDAKRRGDAFALAFRAHLTRLREEPAAYGRLGLATLLEMREECLREFHFFDAYRAVKQRENDVSLSVLPDLLAELDSIPPEERLLTVMGGVLAANIFDWGSRECVKLYRSGTILEIYRMSRDKMKRPWRVDDFDSFHQRWQHRPYGKALLFVDNAGADVVLGMLPLAREMLRAGTNVVLVANSLPAINDVTADELTAVVAEAAQYCPVLRAAAEAGGVMEQAALWSTQESQGGNEQQGEGRQAAVQSEQVLVQNQQQEQQKQEEQGQQQQQQQQGGGKKQQVFLSVVASGSGSPCIDFRQVTWELAQACQGADLVVLEGMGRSLHTNYDTRFTCDSLKLAMIKNERLARRLVGGSMYDCVCRFQPGTKAGREGDEVTYGTADKVASGR
ncbi:unnamed protein product, partial [Closterium sp. NIES-53]